MPGIYYEENGHSLIASVVGRYYDLIVRHNTDYTDSRKFVIYQVTFFPEYDEIPLNRFSTAAEAVAEMHKLAK